MGDRGIIQGATQFFLPKTEERAALAALRSSRYASYTELAAAKTLTRGLAAIGWLVHRDTNGNIDGLRAADEYSGVVEDDLALLAPFVKRGSTMIFDYVSGVRTVPRRATFDGRGVAVRPLTTREMSAAGAEELLATPDFEPEDPDAVPEPRRPKSGKAPANRKPYGSETKFELGDWLEHPKFGAGLVTATLDGSRIRVAFANDVRVLVNGRR